MAIYHGVDVSALRIVDGTRLDSEPDALGNIGICDGCRDKGSLYVLVNVTGARRADVEGTLVETIMDAYRSSPGGVTGGLLTAIKEANVVLFNDNQRSFSSQRTKGGVYCAVVRPGQEVVLAYAGPVVAVVVGPEGVEHLYSDVEPAEPSAGSRTSTPNQELGANPDIVVSFFKCDFKTGDMIMLASPSLLESGMDDTELANALDEAGVDGLPNDRDLTALLLTNVESAAEAARRSAAPAPEPVVAEVEPAGARTGGLAAAGASAVQSIAGMFRAQQRPSRAAMQYQPPPQLLRTLRKLSFLNGWTDETRTRGDRPPPNRDG